MQWYLHVLRNYVNFSGRARRKEYWMFALFNLIISVVLMVLGMMLSGGGSSSGANLIVDLYGLAVFLPSLGVSVRRLHDIGKSGWFLLLAFIPFVGAIILLVFCCQEGQQGPNQYGPDPKDAASAAPVMASA